jgi:hypothetical protein
MRNYGLILVIACLLAPLHVMALDGTVYPVVTFECNTNENSLKLKSEVKWDDEGRNFKYSVAEGTYNPWDWVSISKIADGTASLVTAKPPLELSCKLGRDTYKILLEPKIFNRNYEGNCGKQLSVIATIYRGNILLLERKEFESFCHGNAPVVRGIKIDAGSGDVKIVTVPKFQFY